MTWLILYSHILQYYNVCMFSVSLCAVKSNGKSLILFSMSVWSALDITDDIRCLEKHYLVSADPSCFPHQCWIGSHCSQNNTGRTPAEQTLVVFNMETELSALIGGCEITSYHFRQSEVSNDGQENNHTGRDEVTEGAVLQLWARWKRQETPAWTKPTCVQESSFKTDSAIQKNSWKSM